MQKFLIGCLVFLAAFSVGSFIGYDSSSRHPLMKALDSFIESQRRAARPMRIKSYPGAETEIYGDWVSADGTPVITLTTDEITDVAKGESYNYRVLRRVNNSSENRLLLQLEGIKPGSNLRTFISLRFSDDGYVSVQGYGRWEDVDVLTPTAMYSLSRNYRFGRQ